MAEETAVGCLKTELLKAAARKREQAPKLARFRTVVRRVEGKSSRQNKENRPQ
jgi:hypothetical protein